MFFLYECFLCLLLSVDGCLCQYALFSLSTLRSSFVMLSYPLLSIVIIDSRCNGKQKQIKKMPAN